MKHEVYGSVKMMSNWEISIFRDALKKQKKKAKKKSKKESQEEKEIGL